MSFYVFFLNEGFSWLLSFSCSNLMCFVFVFSRASHDFWTSHVVICCSWVFSFSIGYSWFLSCSCAFCYSWFFFSRSCFFGLLMFFAFNRLLMTFELLMILCGFLMYFSFNLHDLWVSDYFICCSWLFMFISFLKAAHQSLLSYSWLWIPWPGISAP